MANYIAAGYYRVDNEDIIDVVKEAVHKYEWEGRIGARGLFTCRSGLTQKD